MPIRTCSESVGSCLVQLLDRLQDAEAGPDGALRIVLVCRRGAEDGHDRVPDELLDRAAVALDVLPQAGVVGADAGADVLGVSRFRGGGEADEVAEEDGHDLALLLHGCRRLRGQRRRTERAEGELARQLLAARRACRHARSLRRPIATNVHGNAGVVQFMSRHSRFGLIAYARGDERHRGDDVGALRSGVVVAET